MANITTFSSNKGSVLVMVLWVLALLAMIVVYYSSQVKIMRNASRYLFDTTRARMAAFSILKMVAKNMSEEVEANGQNSTVATNGDGVTIFPNIAYTTRIGGIRVRFTLENEAGKIDLNRVDQDFLRDFMRYLIGEDNPTRADTITDSILDWRDSDKLSRTNGAEDNIYNELIPPYSAANAPFKNVEELRLVHGVTDKLFFGPLNSPNIPTDWKGGLVDLFTVFGTGKKINKDFSPAPLRGFLEEHGNEVQSTRSPTWLLKVWIGQRYYKVYFQRLRSDPWYKIKYFSQGVGN